MKPMMTKIEDLFAVKCFARYLAKKYVQAELKEQGVRVTLVKPAEINARAMAYIEQHPEIYEEAWARFEKSRLKKAIGSREATL
jgi:NAD(P)-dependent dehydrogenase (short-subunit alcohol dehydrogenase family)